MRFSLIALIFVATAAASPWPWAQPQADLAATATASGKVKGNATHKLNRTKTHHHKEPTPVFMETCECPEPIVPINILSDNEKCMMKQAAALGCYRSSNGGCPSPAPACGLGVL